MIWLDQIQGSFASRLCPEDAERCQRQFAAARKEMAAFVEAIRIRYGRSEAIYAAECWIQLAENEEVPLVAGYPDWRHITIAAASQFAKRLIPNPPTELEVLAQAQVAA